MHSRLLPLNPPLPAYSRNLPLFAVRWATLPSMPWIEFGFFSVMIIGLIGFGA